MTFRMLIRGGVGLGWLLTGLVWTPGTYAQSTSGASTFSVQPMFVPMMTANGQAAPVNPLIALSNPFYSPYGTGTTNQQMGLMMLTAPSRMGGIGSGQMSGSRPNPNAPGAKGRLQAMADLERDPSAVRRATQPAVGVASRYFGRQSPSHKSEPRGRFSRQSKYFP